MELFATLYPVLPLIWDEHTHISRIFHKYWVYATLSLMKTTTLAHRIRFTSLFMTGVLSLVALILCIVPLWYDTVCPVCYIQCEEPVLTLETPYIESGEVDVRPVELYRGDSCRVLEQGPRFSRVKYKDSTLDVENRYLAQSRLQALTPKSASVSRPVNLRLDRSGTLDETVIRPGDPFEITGGTLEDFDASCHVLRWYQIRYNGQTGYLPGTALTWTELRNENVPESFSAAVIDPHAANNNVKSIEETAPSKPFRMPVRAIRETWRKSVLHLFSNVETKLDPELASALDYEGYLQPSWPENRRPDSIRGLNISLDNLVAFPDMIMEYMEESRLNTLVVTIKDEYGKIGFIRPDATVSSADPTDPIIDPALAQTDWAISAEHLQSVLARLQAENIYLVARIETFLDPLLAGVRTDLKISQTSEQSAQWVNPYQRDVWEYNLELARECAALGFKEIQFDSVCFPDQLDDSALLNPTGETRLQAIQNFLFFAREELESLRVYTSATIEPDAIYDGENASSGQSYEAMLNACNVLYPLPYLYTLQNHPANYGIEVFTSAFDVMSSFTRLALDSTPASENAADVVFSIQGFGLMSPETLQAQMEGVLRAEGGSFVINTIDGSPDKLYPLQNAFFALEESRLEAASSLLQNSQELSDQSPVTP